MAIHAHCQQRMMATTTSHSTVCGVCREPYRNVRFKLTYVRGEAGKAARDDRYDDDADDMWYSSDMVYMIPSLLFLFYAVGAICGCPWCEALLVPGAITTIVIQAFQMLSQVRRVPEVVT